MADREFFDTNILIYASDRSAPEKQSQARRLLKHAIENETGVVSAQVLSEFFMVVTRRIQEPLPIEEAEQVIEQLAILSVVDIDVALVRQAIGTCRRYQISYWDALIIAAAGRAGCTRILSEDLNPGQTYHNVAVVNPF
ncbi:MAG: PIN domain-containing protein [Nitrospira sp.]|nr:PIN domain-containing protein [Nitrospira sp.]